MKFKNISFLIEIITFVVFSLNIWLLNKGFFYRIVDCFIQVNWLFIILFFIFSSFKYLKFVIFVLIRLCIFLYCFILLIHLHYFVHLISFMIIHQDYQNLLFLMCYYQLIVINKMNAFLIIQDLFESFSNWTFWIFLYWLLMSW